jgi:hypothetical protein
VILFPFHSSTVIPDPIPESAPLSVFGWHFIFCCLPGVFTRNMHGGRATLQELEQRPFMKQELHTGTLEHWEGMKTGRRGSAFTIVTRPANPRPAMAMRVMQMDSAVVRSWIRSIQHKESLTNPLFLSFISNGNHIKCIKESRLMMNKRRASKGLRIGTS